MAKVCTKWLNRLEQSKEIITMKKLLIGLLLTCTVAVNAQVQSLKWQQQTFLGPSVGSLIVSNLAYGVTNLADNAQFAASATWGAGTNTWGTSYTNKSGTYTYVTNNAAITNTSLTHENDNLLSDVELFSYANSAGIPFTGNIASTVVSNSPYSIFIRMVGQSGANANVNFLFSALPDGTNNTSVTGDTYLLQIAANTTTEVCVATNIPYRFGHARKLRLRSITNTDADATSNVIIKNCDLIGWRAD